MGRTTELLGYMGCDLFHADYSCPEVLLQPIRMPITFHYILMTDIVLYEKYLFGQFQAYNKYFKGIKTKPTSSPKQPDNLSMEDVGEGALCPYHLGSASAHLPPLPHP